MMKAFLLLFLMATAVPVPCTAGPTGLPIPRFVSLRSNQVNLRTGPGMRYPVEWVYMKSDLPVEITAEFEHWRKIKDWDGKEGWVHRHMLSGRRTVRLKQEALLLRAPAADALPAAKAEAGVTGRLILCPEGMNFCKVEFHDFQGWVPRKSLWGVYPREVFE
ncbi:MAG: SH3 domain-containing protein [Alphaproteobacteria bacterium]|jgi:SH3-like domain-containing protein